MRNDDMQGLKERAIEIINSGLHGPPLFTKLIRRAALYTSVIITVALIAYETGRYLN